MSEVKGIARVRFAPSPTGAPHIGNIRTALFNWLFARHHDGIFVLRIEDTDVARRVPGALAAIFDSLRWLGLDWNEGPEVDGPFAPYFQSQRLPIYQTYVQRLLDEGKAYRCYCSQERLAGMRREQEQRKEPPGYDRRCRNLSPAESEAFEGQGIVPVVRFAVPLEGQTTFHDLIRGEIIFANAVLDDFVMLKSDGYPTYHLANVVDDHLMEISHVLRAEEWIPSAPRHVLLYRALGWEPPLFAHLPMILGPDRSKLSKRHGATSLSDYRKDGFIPEAIVNYLALLGWSSEDQREVFSREELIQRFDLDRVGPTPAIFSRDKLEWMNGHYINHILSVEDVALRCLPFLKEAGLAPDGDSAKMEQFEQYVDRIIPLVKERMKRLNEITGLTDFFFINDLAYDKTQLVGKNMTPEASGEALLAARERLARFEEFDADIIEGVLRRLAEDLQLKTGQLFMILRVAVSGRTVSPPLFETMAVLGRERTLRRLGTAAQALEPLEAKPLS